MHGKRLGRDVQSVIPILYESVRYSTPGYRRPPKLGGLQVVLNSMQAHIKSVLSFHYLLMQRPKVIFLDAVGTLFGVKGSVGKVYSEIAQRFGVEVSDSTLNQAFLQSFQAAPPPIFPVTEPEKIPEREFEWWQNIALHTFQEVGVLHQFPDFSAFFTELYYHFATAEPWFVYPDVRPSLENWQYLGIELGVLSNFDSRLYLVLQTLDLAQFFSSVTISTEVGAAKPDPKIFAVALDKHDCLSELAVHIGDSFREDYQGAQAAGLRAIWLKRSEKLMG